jgi:hypothetical protein
VILRALRAEIERRTRVGSQRLAQAKRCPWFKRRGEEPVRVRISSGMDYALISENRARAALALLSDQEPIDTPASFDGLVVLGMLLSVEPEQYEDFADGSRPFELPARPADASVFGRFE